MPPTTRPSTTAIQSRLYLWLTSLSKMNKCLITIMERAAKRQYRATTSPKFPLLVEPRSAASQFPLVQCCTKSGLRHNGQGPYTQLMRRPSRRRRMSNILTSPPFRHPRPCLTAPSQSLSPSRPDSVDSLSSPPPETVFCSCSQPLCSRFSRRLSNPTCP